MLGFNFGAGSTAAASGANLTFGNTAPASTTGFNFGGFGGASSGTTGLATATATPSIGGFGAAGFSSGTTFQQPSTSTTTSTLGGFGGLGGFNATATIANSAAPAFKGFFTTTGNSTSTTSTVPSLGLGGGLGGFGLSSSSAAPTIFQQSTTSSSAPGLGGADHKNPLTSGLTSSASAKGSDRKTIKDNVVIPEILATVEEFNKHIKTQKTVRENITRMTAKPLFKVEDDLKDMRQQLHEIATLLQKNSTSVDKLKIEATQELKNVETAQRTKETPPGLQYENILPTEYFQKLADDFERQMSSYRHQFLEAENFFSSINHSSATSPAELASVLVKLNEGFVALAARLQVVHEAVKNQKESYLQFRKRHLCDNSDIFKKSQTGRPNATTQSSLAKNNQSFSSSLFPCGSSVASVALSSAVNQTIPQNPSTAQTGIGLFSHQATSYPQQSAGTGAPMNANNFNQSTVNPFLSPAAQTTFFSPPAASTPLQKSGNKRGKNA